MGFESLYALVQALRILHLSKFFIFEPMKSKYKHHI